MLRCLSVLLLSCASPSAWAAGLDADGVPVPIHEGALQRPGLVAVPPLLDRGGVAVGLQGGLRADPLVRTVDGVRERLVGTGGYARLQVAAAPLSPLALSVDMPVRLAAASDVGAPGAAPGDASLHVTGRLRGDHGQLALGGFVSAPTGRKDAYAGVGRAVPGARISALGAVGPVVVAGALDVSHEGAVDAPAALGGTVIGGGIGVVLPADRMGVSVSARANAPLSEEVRARRGVMAEAGVHLQRVLTDRVTVHGGVTAALADAAGSAVATGVIGIVGRFGRPEVPGVADAWSHTWTVITPDGEPLSGAIVGREGDPVARSDADGRLTVTAPRPLDDLVVRAPGVMPTPLSLQEEQVQVPWAPIDLVVRVGTEAGEAVDPEVVVIGDGGDERPFARVAPGEYRLSVPVGRWTVAVTAEGYGAQFRRLQARPRRLIPLETEVVLLPLRGDARLDLAVHDPQAEGVLGAEIRVDGVSVGTSADLGVTIEGLERKVTDVVVGSRYLAEEATAIDLSEGRAEAEVDLYYAPGTVRIVGRGPFGPLRDAVVTLDGPRALPPIRLGERGERLVELAEGTWTLLLSSPAFGLQERTLVVDRDAPVPILAEFRLLPEVAGDADLEIVVRDASGRLLDGVPVAVDGVSVGRTGTGGALTLADLPAARVEITAGGTPWVVRSVPVMLHSGEQRLVLQLDWEAGAVRVSARAPDGPADALVLFDGPAPYEGGRLGPSGRRLFSGVPDGEWELVASHSSGIEVAWALVDHETQPVVDVAIRLGERDGAGRLDVLVTDPGGAPVSNAAVLVDGEPVAATSSAGRLRVTGLDEGRRQVQVRHPWFETATRGVDVIQLPRVTTIPLSWAPGVIDLVVTDHGRPVADGLVHFAGVEPVGSRPLSAQGRLRVRLTPGTWDVLVSSPSAGLAERTIEVSDAAGPPQEVPIPFDATGDLLVRVVDRNGTGIADLPVRVDGVYMGHTAAGGLLPVPRDGAVTVSIADPRVAGGEVSVAVPAEAPEATIEVELGTVDVAVSLRGDGAPAAATLRAVGPRRVAPVSVEGDGVLALPPGRWDLLASAPGFGVSRVTVDIEAGVSPEPVVFELVEARVSRTATALELVDVRFPVDEAVPLSEYAALLEEVAATVLASPDIVALEVHGHTDSTGQPAYNVELSRRRAQAVVDALIRLGVPPHLLVARGFGATRPIAPNDTPEGRQENRRVSFRVSTDASMARAE